MIIRAALVALLAVLTGCSTATVDEAVSPAATATASSTPTASPSSASTPSATPTRPATSQPARGVSGLPVVPLADLPTEAQQTYELIWDGGPFAYRQDDQVFGNREGLLPRADYGWYREYTVETPGSRDRGARRFVVSDDNVFFYTDDHYDSFREVIE